MPTFSMKFSDAPQQEPLDEGTEYTLVIAGIVIKDTKAGDSQNINFEFDVEEAPGRKVWKLFNNKPQALWAVAAFLNAVEGYDKYAAEDFDLTEEDQAALIGQKVGATMTTETNPENGKERSVPGNWFHIEAF